MSLHQKHRHRASNHHDIFNRLRHHSPQRKQSSDHQIDPSAGGIGTNRYALALHVFRPLATRAGWSKVLHDGAQVLELVLDKAENHPSNVLLTPFIRFLQEPAKLNVVADVLGEKCRDGTFSLDHFGPCDDWDSNYHVKPTSHSDRNSSMRSLRWGRRPCYARGEPDRVSRARQPSISSRRGRSFSADIASSPRHPRFSSRESCRTGRIIVLANISKIKFWRNP